MADFSTLAMPNVSSLSSVMFAQDSQSSSEIKIKANGFDRLDGSGPLANVDRFDEFHRVDDFNSLTLEPMEDFASLSDATALNNSTDPSKISALDNGQLLQEINSTQGMNNIDINDLASVYALANASIEAQRKEAQSQEIQTQEGQASVAKQAFDKAKVMEDVRRMEKAFPLLAQQALMPNTSSSSSVPSSKFVAPEQSLYIDTHQLNKIKYSKDTDQGLMKAAEQFEALFLQQMLTRMRRATEALASEDNPLSRNKESMFQDMLDNQYAVSMAQTTSFGLAERLYEQLSSNLNQASLSTGSRF